MPSFKVFRGAVLVVLSLVLLGASASATLRYVYTVNADDNTISIFSVNPGTGLLRAAGYQLTGPYPKAAAIVAGKFLYVINVDANNIYGYKINAATGQLTRIAGAFATGSQPFAILAHPNGKYVYVANSASNTISAFWVNATTGALTRFATYGTGTMPRALALNPTARYLYVANYGSNNVSAYVVNPSWGTLTRVAGSPFTAGSQPRDVLVEPKGTYLYVANAGSSNISAYRINATTGVPAMIGAPAPTGKTPRSLATDSNGIFLYTANRDSNNVSGFRINRSTGTLTSLVPATFGAGSQPRVVQVDPTNKLLFVGNINSRNVYTYAINSTTGVLTRSSIMQSRGQVEGMTLLSGANPVTYTPKFLYASGDPITGYSIDPVSGALKQLPASLFTGMNGSLLAADPFGKFLFVAVNEDTDAEGCPYSQNCFSIDTYMIDQTTGALINRIRNWNYYYVAQDSLSVDPSGRFVYATFGPGGVPISGTVAFTVNRASGALTEIPGSVYLGPIRVMDPVGRFLAVENGATVTLFKIDATKGTVAYLSSFSAVFSGYICGGGIYGPLLTAEQSGRFLYCMIDVWDDGSQGVAGLAISPSTGTLSLVPGSPFDVTTGYPMSLAADPVGRYLFASSMEGVPGSSPEYRVQANGSLAVINGGLNGGTEWMAMDCSGTFLYASDWWPLKLDRPTGTLTAVAGSDDIVSSATEPNMFVTTCNVQ